MSEPLPAHPTRPGLAKGDHVREQRRLVAQALRSALDRHDVGQRRVATLFAVAHSRVSRMATPAEDRVNLGVAELRLLCLCPETRAVAAELVADLARLLEQGLVPLQDDGLGDDNLGRVSVLDAEAHDVRREIAAALSDGSLSIDECRRIAREADEAGAAHLRTAHHYRAEAERLDSERRAVG